MIKFNITIDVFQGNPGITDQEISRLASVFSPQELSSIALDYLGIKQTDLDNWKYEHPSEAEAYKRKILTKWTYSNPSPDAKSVKVLKLTCETKILTIPF